MSKKIKIKSKTKKDKKMDVLAEVNATDMYMFFERHVNDDYIIKLIEKMKDMK